MSDTPRTDEQELAYEAEDGSTYVHTTFARKLERENNELRKDKERLDWLLSEDSNADIEVGRYGRGEEYKPWVVDTIHNRADIDEAMEIGND